MFANVLRALRVCGAVNRAVALCSAGNTDLEVTDSSVLDLVMRASLEREDVVVCGVRAVCGVQVEGDLEREPLGEEGGLAICTARRQTSGSRCARSLLAFAEPQILR